MAERGRSRPSPRAVVHLAAGSSVGDSWERSGRGWRVNALGTVNVLEAVRTAGAGRTGARRLDGRGLRPGRGDADDRGRARSHRSRRTRRPRRRPSRVRGRRQRDGLDVVVARAFQHEGPGRDERFAVGSWSAQIARARGSRRRHASQVGRSLRRAATSPTSGTSSARTGAPRPGRPAGTYNVASGEPCEIARACLDISSAWPAARSTSSATRAHAPRRPRPSSAAMPRSLRAATGWQPRFPSSRPWPTRSRPPAVSERMASA